jgi:hypothetical protein
MVLPLIVRLLDGRMESGSRTVVRVDTCLLPASVLHPARSFPPPCGCCWGQVVCGLSVLAQCASQACHHALLLSVAGGVVLSALHHRGQCQLLLAVPTPDSGAMCDDHTASPVSCDPLASPLDPILPAVDDISALKRVFTVLHQLSKSGDTEGVAKLSNAACPLLAGIAEAWASDPALCRLIAAYVKHSSTVCTAFVAALDCGSCCLFFGGRTMVSLVGVLEAAIHRAVVLQMLPFIETHEASDEDGYVPLATN